MVEITRGRTWKLDHLLYDDLDETVPSDLSKFSNFRSQIRERIATKQADGCFSQTLVANLTIGVVGNKITTSLTREQTIALAIGTYQFDVIAEDEDGDDVELVALETVKVNTKPTLPES